MATEVSSEKELRAQQLDAAEKASINTNKARTGVGTRVRAGQTRGKASQVITWEAFDDSQPDTLPKSIQQFMDVTGKKDESVLVGYLVAGYNDEQYTAASDPIAEFVDPTWPDEVQAQFRLVVRNYARATNSSIEDAVALIKPGIVNALAK